MSNKDIFYPGPGDRFPAFYIQYNKETNKWEVYFHNWSDNEFHKSPIHYYPGFLPECLVVLYLLFTLNWRFLSWKF